MIHFPFSNRGIYTADWRQIKIPSAIGTVHPAPSSYRPCLRYQELEAAGFANGREYGDNRCDILYLFAL